MILVKDSSYINSTLYLFNEDCRQPMVTSGFHQVFIMDCDVIFVIFEKMT